MLFYTSPLNLRLDPLFEPSIWLECWALEFFAYTLLSDKLEELFKLCTLYARASLMLILLYRLQLKI